MNQMKIKTFIKGDIIHSSGDIPQNMFIIKEGEAQCFKKLIIEESNVWPQSTK